MERTVELKQSNESEKKVEVEERRPQRKYGKPVTPTFQQSVRNPTFKYEYQDKVSDELPW